MAPSSSSSLPVTPAALSIRGASLRRAGDRRRAGAVVPGLVANNRRNAIEPWKEFVTKRYNPELQLLNLSVRFVLFCLVPLISPVYSRT